MKKMRLIALMAAIAIILSSAQVFAFAAEETAENTATCACGTVYYFEEGVSEETKARVVAAICEETEYTAVQPRNVLCDLFGHNMDTDETYAYEHKVYSSSPRCIKYTYNYDTCTRCGYSEEYLVSSERFDCCS